MAPIEVLDVALPQVAHEPRARIHRLRSEQQMDVVRHQAVGMDGAVVPLGQLPQMRQIHQVVVIVPEASNSIVAALDNMDGNARKDEPQWPRHARDNESSHAALTEIGL
jgi:hypothetical protein